jgi:hypothetical protein
MPKLINTDAEEKNHTGKAKGIIGGGGGGGTISEE